MGILEKLRPQPRWKHADPAVRAAAVYKLGPEDDDALRQLAREDVESRVRRAAVSRVSDAALLGDVARTDPDEDVRAEAIRNLAGVAAESEDLASAAGAAHQLIALGRLKEVGLVVRDSASAAVRAAVISLLDDQKTLGSISRHARDGITRLLALARVTSDDELLNVAVKSEHTDSAVAALERVTGDEAWTAIAQRGRNKVASRRARTKIRQAEEAAQVVRDEHPARMNTTDLARAVALQHQAEGVVTMSDLDTAVSTLSATRLAWAELQADTDVDEVLSHQFDAAVDSAREAIAERQQELAAERERADALAREQADRLAIVGEIETLSGADAQDRIAELKVQWDALPLMPSEYAASLTRRFQDACRAYEERERRRVLAQAAVSRLGTLATELEQLLASEQPLHEVVARWRGLRRDADVLREHAATNPEAAARLEGAVAVLEEKEHEYQQVRTKQEHDNLRRLEQLCRQIEVLAEGEITLKAGDRALRDIRTALDERAPLPSKQDRQNIHVRLEAIRVTLAPRVQELRDADEWQRWANVQVQEEICRGMEALANEANLEVAARRMRELQGRWKEVALAPRAQGEAMWRRFKTAQDQVFTKTSTFFAAQHEERAANLVRKQVICEQAEALADSTDWVKTANEIQRLQTDWKGIGPVPRGTEKATWERFRSACDRFFTRRQEDLRRRKDEWSGNLTRKEALCEQAEAAAESTDWEIAAGQLKRLQVEWKTIGPVRKSKSEAVWQRFRGACDRFFERYKHRDQLDLQGKAVARETVIGDLDALAQAEDVPADLYQLVQHARASWQQAPELPRGVQQDLAVKYHDALARLVSKWPAAFAGTDLDPEVTQKRMEKLLARVEELLAAPAAKPQAAALSPTELLAQQWRERLASNTITGSRNAAEAEEARWKNVEQEIRNAQAQWTRMGPVPGEVAGPLNERFQRAVRKFYDRRKKAS